MPAQNRLVYWPYSIQPANSTAPRAIADQMARPAMNTPATNINVAAATSTISGIRQKTVSVDTRHLLPLDRARGLAGEQRTRRVQVLLVDACGDLFGHRIK